MVLHVTNFTFELQEIMPTKRMACGSSSSRIKSYCESPDEEEGEENESNLLWSDFIKIIDDRLEVYQKRELSEHLALLKSWEASLEGVEKWYETNGRNFETLADDTKLQYIASQEKNLPINIVYHDHTYCLKPYQKSKQLFIPHECNHGCAGDTISALASPSHFSPLEVVLQLGWQRTILRRCDGRHMDTYYTAPCGRKLRSMDELKYFLDITGVEDLNGINFTFDPSCSLTSVDPEVQAEETFVCIPDISQGREKIPISCVNTYNLTEPDCVGEHFEYMTSRTFEPHIPRMETPEFLVCCSCTDNCSNRSKCECWQLTLEEAKVIGNVRYSVGYVHQRLKRPQHSAVYECNSGCGCGARCSNRVVQHGVTQKLQLFHTKKPELKWGLRTLCDIPMGSYVCSYIGHVYTEQGAEMKAIQHGDEYFADLDYIEVMEYHKAGYEAEVFFSEESSATSDQKSSLISSTSCTSLSRTPLEATPPNAFISSDDSEDSHDPTSPLSQNSSNNLQIVINPASLTSQNSTNSPQTVINPASPTSQNTSFNPQTMIDSPLPSFPSPGVQCLHRFSPRQPHPHPKEHRLLKTRTYYKEDFTYVMDAKCKGNMARYINHSCDPNLFVQNVFVDTHDLRFPWVAFFAKRMIKAMEELTWNYNYEIGSVENKVIWCLCGAPNCRKRLL